VVPESREKKESKGGVKEGKQHPTFAKDRLHCATDKIMFETAASLTINNKKQSFQTHMGPLTSISLTLSQTQAFTIRSRIQG